MEIIRFCSLFRLLSKLVIFPIFDPSTLFIFYLAFYFSPDPIRKPWDIIPYSERAKNFRSNRTIFVHFHEGVLSQIGKIDFQKLTPPNFASGALQTPFISLLNTFSRFSQNLMRKPYYIFPYSDSPRNFPSNGTIFVHFYEGVPSIIGFLISQKSSPLHY